MISGEKKLLRFLSSILFYFEALQKKKKKNLARRFYFSYCRVVSFFVRLFEESHYCHRNKTSTKLRNSFGLDLSHRFDFADLGSQSIIKTPVKSRILSKNRRLNRIWDEIQKLKHEVDNLFIIDIDPMLDALAVSNDSSAASSHSLQSTIIEGRILPTSEPYCRRSFRVRFTIPPMYPFESPDLRFLDPIYYPSVSEDGQICNEMLDKYCWNPLKTSLADIIVSTVQIISNPELKDVIDMQTYREYNDNRDEFNKKALQLVLKYGQPRT